MSILLTLVGQWWKPVFLGLVASALIIGGFKAATWRADAAQLAVAKAEVRHQIERTVALQVRIARGNKARLALQEKLTIAESRIGSGVRVIQKTIRQDVKATPDCDVPISVGRMLNSARAGNLPLPATTP